MTYKINILENANDDLNTIQNLKDNIISKYEVINNNVEQKDFIKISEKSFENIWDNKEDAIYDKFL